jgi:TRAP-type C4-dicarboxylate transport system substrate-binding protein
VEQIQYFDSLSEERQTAFERIVDNMTTEKIDKYLKLDIAKLEKSVQEVVEISK